ncbi:vascular endothelial growth factor receptor 1 isoform X2 [Sphaerodactylus townsendi]|uniref:vascular endothelial growth factor receptor 1 isoform X2 n=1 Tax=Sphaerodactylus townsendi TaxID=933632 RepID=UPI002026E66E|nr:vascular endothelial growth factor receptor 1 isoform X2 [Sphaerodactylus townsendi]
MFCWGLPGAVLGGLLGSWLLLAGSPLGFKVRSPKLNIRGKQHVTQAGDALNIMCSGEVAHSWSLPEGLSKDSKRLNITTYTCGRNRRQFCSRLTLNRAQANDTGYYSCKYPSSSAVRKKTVSTIYIFINDTHSPFVEVHSNEPKTILMTAGQELIIPCRVTAPDIPVILRKIAGAVPSGKTIWDSTKGFIIPNATFEFIGLFKCEATIGGYRHKSTYLTYRQNNEIINVSLNASRPVKLLKGDNLVLNCTVTASWNTRPLITWNYPGERNKRGTITSSINQRNYGANVFYSILVIDKVRDIDKGLYTCNVTSSPSLRLVNATVHIYDKAFISLKHRRKNVLEVTSGKKSYRISMKVKAFPTPEVVWLKDGLPAAEMCARYRIKSHSLTIKHVADEDAGDYTILLSTPKWNLHKNLTVTLRVNVKPQIYEKMSSFPGPNLYQVGSKQTLTCTVYGIPQPTIKWTWNPCQQNHSRSRRDFCSNPERPFTLKFGSTTGNRIHSITQRTSMIEGKNKTASILIVDESNVSGIYTCIASNKLGTDERSIRYFVTDVPSGFHINLEKMPIEGDNLVLSCLANKFLYKDIAWILPRTVNNQTRVKKATTKEYSIDLTLTIKNISLEHSGSYACRARNIYTGEEVLQKKDVTVRAQEAPFLLRNLTDQVVNTSHSVTLECLVHGLPEPQISWLKNNKEIQHQPGIILGPGSQSLLIERVQEEDGGLYRCVAANLKGVVESSAFVTVQGISESSNVELITLTCTCVVATLFWLLLTLFIRKLKRPYSSEIKTDYLSIIMDPEEVPLDEQCERLPYDASKWEFARERLKLGKILGQGAFGKVIQAAAFGIKKSPTYKVVAVKMLKEGATASEYKALMTELKILIHVGHHLNVVNLLGACTKSGGPLMVIVEYCKYGNLSSYLKSKRNFFLTNKDASVRVELTTGEKDVEPIDVQNRRLESIPSSESLASSGFLEDKSLSDEEEEDADDFYKWPLTMEDLISYSFQVARGMEFLSSQKCLHRDLAARNILLSENNVVKICDFGLARDIYKNPDYVRKGDARLPLKWMAPESIFDKIYSTKSDVWSYGVLLWEIFSLGASPYPGVQIDEDFFSKLKEGVRMKAPDFATAETYEIMLDCWQSDPNERPRFSELVKKLGDLLQANVQQGGKDYIPLNILSVDSGFDCSTSSVPQRNEDESAPPLNSGHTENSGYVNVFKMKPPQRVKTFEELSPKERSGLDGYQADRGLVLPSERLKRFTWTGSKQKQTLFGLLSASRSKDSVFMDSTKQNLYSFSCGHISDATRPFPWGNTMWEKKVAEAFPSPTYNSVVL